MRFYLHRHRINQSGYDSTGYYWGIDKPLYRYASEDGSIDRWTRARNRQEAKELIKHWHPEKEPTFFN